METIDDDVSNPSSALLRSVQLSIDDAADQLKVLKTCMTVMGEKGHRMIRATHGINEGYMYFEMRFNRPDALPLETRMRIQEQQQQALLQLQLQSHRNHSHHNLYYYNLRHDEYDETVRINSILKHINGMSLDARMKFRRWVYADAPSGKIDLEYMGTPELAEIRALYDDTTFDPPFFIGHLRVGFSQSNADLQLPLGAEESSFAYCSALGCKTNRSLRLPFNEGFHPGDVIGCLLYLPSSQSENTDRSKDTKGGSSGSDYAREGKSSSSASDLSADINQYHYINGSYIAYFKNGVSLGKAFQDLAGGTYFPSVSLYQFASSTFNFGPDFAYPPREICKHVYVKTSSLLLAHPMLRKVLRTQSSTLAAQSLDFSKSREALEIKAVDESNSNIPSPEEQTSDELLQQNGSGSIDVGKEPLSEASKLDIPNTSQSKIEFNWPLTLLGETKDTYFDIHFIEDAEFAARKRIRPPPSSSAANRAKNKQRAAAAAATAMAAAAAAAQATQTEEDVSAEDPQDISMFSEYVVRMRLLERPKLIPNPDHQMMIKPVIVSTDSNTKKPQRS